MVKCVVGHCKNDAFIRFPHPTSSVFQKWLEVLADEELNNLEPATLYTDKRICHTHFNRQSRRKLDKAVPTLHLTTHDVQKKRKETTRDEETDDESPASSPQKQQRSQSLEIETVCRTCLAKDATYNLFLSMYKGYSLIYLMEDHLNIIIKKCDGISSKICNNCMNKIQDFYNFTRQVQSAELTLQTLKEEMRSAVKKQHLKNPRVVIEYVKPLHENDDERHLCEEDILREDPTPDYIEEKAVYDTSNDINQELKEEIVSSSKINLAVIEDDKENKPVLAPNETEIEETLPNESDCVISDKPTRNSDVDNNGTRSDTEEVVASVDYDVAIKENVLYNTHASEQQVYDDFNDLHIGREIEVIATTPEPSENRDLRCDCCEAPEYDSETPEETENICKSKVQEWNSKVLRDLTKEEIKIQLIENENVDLAEVYLSEMLEKYNFTEQDEGTDTIVGFFALQKNGSNTGQLQEVFGLTKRKLAQEIDDDPTVIFSYGDICKITLYDPMIGKVYIAIERRVKPGETAKKNYVDILTSVFKYDVPSSIRKSKLIKIYYKLKTDKPDFVVSDLQEMDENLGISVLGKNNFPSSLNKRYYNKFHIYQYKIVNPYDDKPYHLFQITYNDYRDVLIPHLKEFHHKIIQQIFNTENIINSYYFVENYSIDFIKNFQQDQLIPVDKSTLRASLFQKPIINTNELDMYLRVAVYDISRLDASKALIRFKEDVTLFNTKIAWHTRHWIATKQLFLKFLYNSDIPDNQETIEEKIQNDSTDLRHEETNEEFTQPQSNLGKCIILDHIILTKPRQQEIFPNKTISDETENHEVTSRNLVKKKKNERSSDHVGAPRIIEEFNLIPFQKPRMVLVKTNELSRKIEIVSAMPDGINSSPGKQKAQVIRKSDRRRFLNSKYYDEDNKEDNRKLVPGSANIDGNNSEIDSVSSRERKLSSDELNVRTSKLKEVISNTDNIIDAESMRKENEFLVKTLKEMSCLSKKEESIKRRTGSTPKNASFAKGSSSGRLKIEHTSPLKRVLNRNILLGGKPQSTVDIMRTEKGNKIPLENLKLNLKPCTSKNEERILNQPEPIPINANMEDAQEISPRSKINRLQQVTKKQEPISHGTDSAGNIAKTVKGKEKELMIKISTLKDVNIVRMKKVTKIYSPEKLKDKPCRLNEITRNKASVDCVEKVEEISSEELKISPLPKEDKSILDNTDNAFACVNVKEQTLNTEKRSPLLKIIDVIRPEKANIENTITADETERSSSKNSSTDEQFLPFGVDNSKINVPQPDENINNSVTSEDVDEEFDMINAFRGFSPEEQTAGTAILEALKPKSPRRKTRRKFETRKPETRSNATKSRNESLPLNESNLKPECDKSQSTTTESISLKSTSKERDVETLAAYIDLTEDSETSNDDSATRSLKRKVDAILSIDLTEEEGAVTKKLKDRIPVNGDQDIHKQKPPDKIQKSRSHRHKTLRFVEDSRTGIPEEQNGTKRSDINKSTDNSKFEGTEIDKSFFLGISPAPETEHKRKMVLRGDISTTKKNIQSNEQDVQISKGKSSRRHKSLAPPKTRKQTRPVANVQSTIENPPKPPKKLIVKIQQSEMDAVLAKLKPAGARRKRYDCKRCPKVFKSSRYLFKHSMREHVKIRMKCLRCKRQCSSYQTMVKHIYERHNDSRSKSLWCGRCGHMSRSFSSMEEHKRTVHSCTVKKFKCHDCPRRFRTSTLLKIHLLGL